MEDVRSGNYCFLAISYKIKPDCEGMGPFHCLIFRLNLIMYYRPPSIIITIGCLYAKPLSILETKTLGRWLQRLLKYCLVKAVVPLFVRSADAYHGPTVCPAFVRSRRGEHANELQSLFANRVGKRLPMSNHAFIYSFRQHSLPVFSVPVRMLGKLRWTKGQSTTVPSLAGGW